MLYNAAMRDDVERWRWSAWERGLRDNLLEIVVALVLGMCVGSQLLLYFQRDIFGHDDLSQITTYFWNVEGEGRWLNWLVFPMARYFSTKLALIVDLLLLGYFGYRCVRNWLDTSSCFIVALVVLLMPSVVAFLDWPIIAMPAFLILALAALTAHRMPMLLYFCLYGALFNASYSNIYFLLPLLFLHEESNSLGKMLLFWIVGYLAGFIVAEVATLFICGHFIELAQWRKPDYIASWQDVTVNVAESLRYFSTHLRYMGKAGILLVGGAALVFVYQFRKEKIRGAFILVVLTLVGVSAYAQSMSAGLFVSLRTVHCLYFALLMGIIVSFHRHKSWLMLALLIWGGRCFSMNAMNMEWQNTLRNCLYSGIAQIEMAPGGVEGVLMLSSDEDVASACDIIKRRLSVDCFAWGSYNLDHWSATAKHAGFKTIWYRDIAQEKCRELGIEPEKLVFQKSGMYRWARVQDYLLLQLDLQDPYGNSNKSRNYHSAR